MKFILLFALLLGTFSSYYNAVKEDLPPSLVYVKNHFHPCIAVLLHKQSLLAAARCYLSSHKVLVEHFLKKSKDKIEKTIDSMQIIGHWNVTTDSFKYPLTSISKSTSVIPGVTNNYTVSDLDWSPQNGTGNGIRCYHL
ncbi:probable inactive serine protease 37 isoform X2 [Notamacropus eugenii]|uniref:probable inactive serine protease 37 isoform X2 n=1 Tax=Notamacropus eugenii TaxID=9315 RepID=UPI003B67959C